jgi:hypothetical protein
MFLQKPSQPFDTQARSPMFSSTARHGFGVQSASSSARPHRTANATISCRNPNQS